MRWEVNRAVQQARGSRTRTPTEGMAEMRSSLEKNRIVVGVDGTPAGRRALQWAISEAAASNQTLHLVHCVVPAALEIPPTHSFDPLDHAPSRTAEQILAEAESMVRDAAPWVDVHTELAAGTIAPQLLARAWDADMLVLGSRGLGRFAGLLTGSVGVAAVAYAACPVIVVPPHGTPRPTSPAGRVVVGVDGAGHATRAVDFAFETAARSGLGLTAVLAWSVPFSAHPARMRPVEEILRDGRQRLTAALAAPQKRFPDVDVETKLVRAYPEDALRREAAGANLLVVGSRGLGGLAGLLRGSVSQGLLRRAECPVAVVTHTSSHHAGVAA